MARRRSQQAAISLFSFQDIITSVCGILIFLTLLLALELVERREGTTASPSHQIVADLRSAIALAGKERDALSTRVQAANAGLQAIAVASPLALERQARELEASADQAEKALPPLEERAKLAIQQETRAQARQFDQRAQRQEFTELREKIASLKQQIAREQEDDRVYLNFGGGKQRDGWLVEVAGDHLAVAPLQRKARPIVFDRPGGGLLGLTHDNVIADFLAWSEHDRNAGVYFVFVGRPSGIDRLEALQNELFKAGVPFGFDLVAEEQALLDPENGAFAP